MSDYGRRVNYLLYLGTPSEGKFVKWVINPDTDNYHANISALIERPNGKLILMEYDEIQFLDAPESPEGGES